jgi:hypothetical protein
LEGAKRLLFQIIKALGITELFVALDDHVEHRNGVKNQEQGVL